MTARWPGRLRAASARASRNVVSRHHPAARSFAASAGPGAASVSHIFSTLPNPSWTCAREEHMRSVRAVVPPLRCGHYQIPSNHAAAPKAGHPGQAAGSPAPLHNVDKADRADITLVVHDRAVPSMRAGRPGALSLRKVPAPLRHRDFALLWSGQSVSMAGDGIFIVALALETSRVDNSPTALSLVLAARIVPTVCLLLLGGVVVDRIPRRLAMLTSDAVRGLAVATIAAGIAAGGVHLWALLVMSVIFGVGDAFFAPASVAIVPELLPPDLLVQGSALPPTSQQLARMLAGPPLGGVIVASQGLARAFALDAASFAVRPA